MFRVAGNCDPIWQVTPRSSRTGISSRALFFNLKFRGNIKTRKALVERNLRQAAMPVMAMLTITGGKITLRYREGSTRLIRRKIQTRHCDGMT